MSILPAAEHMLEAMRRPRFGIGGEGRTWRSKPSRCAGRQGRSVAATAAAWPAYSAQPDHEHQSTKTAWTRADTAGSLSALSTRKRPRAALPDDVRRLGAHLRRYELGRHAARRVERCGHPRVPHLFRAHPRHGAALNVPDFPCRQAGECHGRARGFPRSAPPIPARIKPQLRP